MQDITFVAESHANTTLKEDKEVIRMSPMQQCVLAWFLVDATFETEA